MTPTTGRASCPRKPAATARLPPPYAAPTGDKWWAGSSVSAAPHCLPGRPTAARCLQCLYSTVNKTCSRPTPTPSSFTSPPPPLSRQYHHRGSSSPCQDTHPSPNYWPQRALARGSRQTKFPCLPMPTRSGHLYLLVVVGDPKCRRAGTTAVDNRHHGQRPSTMAVVHGGSCGVFSSSFFYFMVCPCSVARTFVLRRTPIQVWCCFETPQNMSLS